MTRISNSFALARASWAVLKADKELMLLPVFSGIASLIIAMTFIFPIVAADAITGSGVVLLVLMYFVLAYVTIFFNAALISAANERLEGGDPTIGSAIKGAARHAGRIVPWALLSAIVSAILRSIEERVGIIGRIVIALVGMAWAVVTFLVLPIIVVEGLGTGRALKKSASLVRTTWGENLAGHVGLGLVGFVLLIPSIILVVVGFVSGGGGVAGVAIGLGIIWGIVVVVVMAALTGIYQTALYRFAVSGNASSPVFDPGLMQSAFYTRRLGRRRR